MNPYDAGYNARLRGVLAQDNPHQYTTSEHAEWNRGWRHAAEDDETTEAQRRAAAEGARKLRLEAAQRKAHE